jgi:hypothetical protein
VASLFLSSHSFLSLDMGGVGVLLKGGKIIAKKLCQIAKSVLSQPFSLASSFRRNSSNNSWRTKRRGGAQDQDRGTVADLRNHCKLVHIEINEKDTFPVPNT